MTRIATSPPDEALALLIRLERIRIAGNFTDACAWCGKPANQKHYPMPELPPSADEEPEEAYYRACGRAHADRFYTQYVALENDILRPWRDR